MMTFKHILVLTVCFVFVQCILAKRSSQISHGNPARAKRSPGPGFLGFDDFIKDKTTQDKDIAKVVQDKDIAKVAQDKDITKVVQNKDIDKTVPIDTLKDVKAPADSLGALTGRNSYDSYYGSSGAYGNPSSYYGSSDSYGNPSSYSGSSDTYGNPSSYYGSSGTYGNPSSYSGSSTSYGNPSSYSGSSDSYGNPSSYSGSSDTYGNPSLYSGSSDSYGNPSPYYGSSGAYGNPSSYSGSSDTYGNPSSYSGSSDTYGNPSSYYGSSGTYGNPSSYSGSSDSYGNPSSYSGSSDSYGNPSSYYGSSGTYGNPSSYYGSSDSYGNPSSYSGSSDAYGNPPYYGAGATGPGPGKGPALTDYAPVDYSSYYSSVSNLKDQTPVSGVGADTIPGFPTKHSDVGNTYYTASKSIYDTGYASDYLDVGKSVPSAPGADKLAESVYGYSQYGQGYTGGYGADKIHDSVYGYAQPDQLSKGLGSTSGVDKVYDSVYGYSQPGQVAKGLGSKDGTDKLSSSSEQTSKVNNPDRASTTGVGLLNGRDAIKTLSSHPEGFPVFCDNPSSLPFDFKITGVDGFKGYFAKVNYNPDLPFLKQFITGQKCLSPFDEPVIKLNIKDNGVHTLTGFGGSSNSVKCLKENLQTKKTLCVTLDNQPAFTPYPIHTDNQSYCLVVRCYANGGQGLTLFTTEDVTLTQQDKTKLEAAVKAAGFNPKDLHYS